MNKYTDKKIDELLEKIDEQLVECWEDLDGEPLEYDELSKLANKTASYLRKAMGIIMLIRTK